MGGFTSQRDDGDVPPAVETRQNLKPPLTVLLAEILLIHHRLPFEIRNTIEGETPFPHGSGVFYRIERNLHTV
jgi:hypothetical protein